MTSALDRLAETFATGRLANRRLSVSGLSVLSRSSLWPDAFRLACRQAPVHRQAQEIFLVSWMKVPSRFIRGFVGDDNLFFSGLKALLPAYQGPAVQVFRGQPDGHPIGPSWTRSYHIAKKFALYGTGNVDPLHLESAKQAPRAGGIILMVAAEADRAARTPYLIESKSPCRNMTACGRRAAIRFMSSRTIS